jgi:hypothetical protein
MVVLNLNLLSQKSTSIIPGMNRVAMEIKEKNIMGTELKDGGIYITSIATSFSI